jgi:hypothetical protein
MRLRAIPSSRPGDVEVQASEIVILNDAGRCRSNFDASDEALAAEDLR